MPDASPVGTTSETVVGKFDFLSQDVSPRSEVRHAASSPAVRRNGRADGDLRPRDWVVTLVVALLVAFVIRSFFIEAFRIPTPSMEKSLLVGDFILVSKLHYGARTPVTIGVPFTNLYAQGFVLPPVRLPGFSEPDRGDVVVFNYPVEEGPVDRKTHYVKRLLGLPGDTLVLRDKRLVVNGREIPLYETMQHRWTAYTTTGAVLSEDSLYARGASEVTPLRGGQRGVAFQSTVALAREVETWENVERVEPLVLPRDGSSGLQVFPAGSGYDRDNYGPLYIPAAGDTLVLTPSNWPVYSDLIRRYEGHQARPLPDGTFEIDGRQVTRYAVEQDYYFVMGDNRDASFDSRVWGFVPADHLVGKAVVIYFSWDEERRRPRYARLMKGID